MSKEKLHHAADKNMCEYQQSVLHGAAVASPCQHQWFQPPINIRLTTHASLR